MKKVTQIRGFLASVYFETVTHRLHFNCLCSGRIFSLFNFSVVDKDWSGRITFAARLWRELGFFRWTSLAPFQTVEALFICESRCAWKKRFYERHCPHSAWTGWAEINSWINAYIYYLCDCHFSSSSIITPSTRCSRTCWTGLFPSVRLRIRGLRWCFRLVVRDE